MNNSSDMLMRDSVKHVLHVLQDEKESEIIFIDETRATQQRNLALMEVHHNHNHEGAENEADFWPVEHPLEPRDEDRPVKCPMPESSVINVCML